MGISRILENEINDIQKGNSLDTELTYDQESNVLTRTSVNLLALCVDA